MTIDKIDSEFHFSTMVINDQIVQVVEFRGEIFLANGAQHARRRTELVSQMES